MHDELNQVPRVLIIDDNTAIHQDFSKILGRKEHDELKELEAELFGEQQDLPQASFDLEFASQGEEGLRKLQQALREERPFALAFVDMRMPPGWDGVETIKQLWKAQPDLHVVICTAYSDYTWSSLVQQLGESDQLLILRKPFDSAEVCQLAAAMTRKFRVQQENQRYRDKLESLLEQKSTSLQQSETRLAETNALFDATLNALTSELAVLDADGVIVHVNQAWENDSEGSPLVGRQCTKGSNYLTYCRQVSDAHASTARKLAQGLQQVITQGDPFLLEYSVTDADGQVRYYAARVNRFREKCGAAVVVTHDDITEIKMLQQQLHQAQKLEAIGQLAAGIAHEINTPMQYVGDNIDLMRDLSDKLFALVDQLEALLKADSGQQAGTIEEVVEKYKPEHLREEMEACLADCNEGFQRVVSIIKAMRHFSHPGTSSKENADLNQMVRDACTVTRNRWKYYADVQLDLDESLGAIECNIAEINQVLLNLVINAADAVATSQEHGGAQKGIITIRTRDDGDYVRLQVEDTGCGIPKDLQSKIFEPFFTTKDVGKGTGQGLSLSYNIVVNGHGGSISVESEAGKGATFTVRLPKQATTSSAAPPGEYVHQEALVTTHDHPTDTRSAPDDDMIG